MTAKLTKRSFLQSLAAFVPALAFWRAKSAAAEALPEPTAVPIPPLPERIAPFYLRAQKTREADDVEAEMRKAMREFELHNERLLLYGEPVKLSSDHGVTEDYGGVAFNTALQQPSTFAGRLQLAEALTEQPESSLRDKLIQALTRGDVRIPSQEESDRLLASMQYYRSIGFSPREALRAEAAEHISNLVGQPYESLSDARRAEFAETFNARMRENEQLASLLGLENAPERDV